MAAKLAIFTSTLVVEFDDADETPEDGLDNYLADHDVSPSYELTAVEDNPNA